MNLVSYYCPNQQPKEKGHDRSGCCVRRREERKGACSQGSFRYHDQVRGAGRPQQGSQCRRGQEVDHQESQHAWCGFRDPSSRVSQG